MTTPTPEAIEAAARALLFRETMSDDGLSLDQMAQITLSAAYPLMEAQAKAEALLAFADAHRMPEPVFMDDGRAVTVGDLLREQAAEYRATTEGKDA